ncbi:MAG: hypothetical protein JWM54_1670, partial [Acidobacteriaceae bacterium]|nr:hypothetical protein [Acidobacteriaceae bacterium]
MANGAAGLRFAQDDARLKAMVLEAWVDG